MIYTSSSTLCRKFFASFFSSLRVSASISCRSCSAFFWSRACKARPLQGGNHRGSIRDGPRFDALAQIVGNQPPGVFLCLQPGPKLRGLNVGPMAGLHVMRPRRIVRAAAAILMVLPVP